VYRRRRTLFGALLALLLAAAAFATAPHLLGDKAHPPLEKVRTLRDKGRTDALAVGWPQRGQAAFLLGSGRPAASPYEQPAPIASLAKVMTAVLTLQRYPLSGAQDGFTITVTAAQAQEEAQDAAQGQSGVTVVAGEPLTERELLEALLIPSGNNIAEILATQVAVSQSRFVSEMNAEARSLGMDHTSYTDPSGFVASTVSTAADQLRVFRRAMRFAVFRRIVAMASVTLPVAGTLTNYDPLIDVGYAGKTGSDAAAGGCLAFFTRVSAGGRRRTAVGVVMGQGQGSDTSVLLAAAGAAAQELVASVAPATPVRTITVVPALGGQRRSAGSPGGRLPQLRAPRRRSGQN
jgi:D-alanyl-D-alanine carboxypeptidase (penicillin-binding protein 5/6)